VRRRRQHVIAAFACELERSPELGEAGPGQPGGPCAPPALEQHPHLGAADLFGLVEHDIAIA
jgi:hypothetical protein